MKQITITIKGDFKKIYRALNFLRLESGLELSEVVFGSEKKEGKTKQKNRIALDGKNPKEKKEKVQTLMRDLSTHLKNS